MVFSGLQARFFFAYSLSHSLLSSICCDRENNRERKPHSPAFHIRLLAVLAERLIRNRADTPVDSFGMQNIR
ncbi:hypothetical protein PSAC2689_40077 [Paraburkholderia sacchari]